MVKLIKRGPFTELLGIRNDMDRFLNDAFGLFNDGYGGERIGAWSPAVDMEETKEDFIISAEIPGIKKEDIKITIVDNTVQLSGEVYEEKELKETQYYLKERSRGKFTRSFTLPTSVNVNKAEAAYKDGILRLKLPKAEEAKPREITISAE